LGQKFIHIGYERRVVRGFQQVDQLMDNHIFQALMRFLGKLRVQANSSPGWSATSPAGSHPSNNRVIYFYTKDWFPFRDEGRCCILRLSAIPGHDDSFPQHRLPPPRRADQPHLHRGLDVIPVRGLRDHQQPLLVVLVYAKTPETLNPDVGQNTHIICLSVSFSVLLVGLIGRDKSPYQHQLQGSVNY
jgi:hypothetical protein